MKGKNIFLYLGILIAASILQLAIMSLAGLTGLMSGDVLPATAAAIVALVPSWFTSTFALAWFGITAGVVLFGVLAVWGMKPPKWSKYVSYCGFLIAVAPFVYVVPNAHVQLITSFAETLFGQMVLFTNGWASYAVGAASILLWLATMVTVIYLAVKKGDIR